MADNFLEKQYAEYEARKAAQAQAKRKAWQKKMKEYQARLAAEKSEKSRKAFSVCYLRFINGCCFVFLHFGRCGHVCADQKKGSEYIGNFGCFRYEFNAVFVEGRGVGKHCAKLGGGAAIALGRHR